MGIKTAGKTFSALVHELGHRSSPGDSKWYTPAETAVLLRVKLKQQFPGASFKVQTETYSGGASIDVHVTNPHTYSHRAIDNVCQEFRAGNFNGMIDLYEYRKTELYGEPVHFGISFVFCYTADGRLPGRE